MNKTFVLDSFAILALLNKESGSEQVAKLLRQADVNTIQLLMTWVNVGEIVYIVERRHGQDHVFQVLGFLESRNIEFIPVDRSLALQAASIKAKHPLAYADAFAAALAVQNNAILVTGDPEFHCLEEKIQIQWLS